MNTVRRWVLGIMACALSLMLLEFGYRWMLFGGHPAFHHLRRPDLHADFLSDDAFWILYQRWDGRYGPPGTPHAELGWVSPLFDRETLLHHEALAVGQRRPVLVFGDSYVYGVPGVETVPDLLNQRLAPRGMYRALNYGVGGYGIDQTWRLMDGALRHYTEPLVVVSVMPLDLDRAWLCVRVGQKPCFDRDLEPKGAQIAGDAARWFAEADPRIWSYAWRKLLFASFTPAGLRDRLRGAASTERGKRALSAALIARMRSLTGQRDQLWVVFDTHYPAVGRTLERDGDWRDEVLASELKGLDVVWGSELIAEELEGRPLIAEHWIRPEDGHPTEHYNALVATKIASWVDQRATTGAATAVPLSEPTLSEN